MTADGDQEAKAVPEAVPGPAPEAVPGPAPAAGDHPRADVEAGVGVEGEAAETPKPRPVNPRSIPKEPEWADQRAMLAEHPRWALATMALFVVGLVAGYVSLGVVGPSLMHKCAAAGAVAACNPRTQGVVLALPVLALGLGLAISFIGGRRLARRGKKAVRAAWAGWAVFLLTAVISYGVVGGHA